MTGTSVLLPSPFQDPVAIRNVSPPGPQGEPPGPQARRGTRRPPGVPGSPGGPGCAAGGGWRWRSGQGSPAHRPCAGDSSGDRAAGDRHPARRARGGGGGPGSGCRRRARTPQPRRAARRYLAAARSPALDPCVRPSVPRASRGGREGVSPRPGQGLSEVMGRTRERSRGGCARSRGGSRRLPGAGGVGEAVSSGLRRPGRSARLWHGG